jgi:hypothetical protein
MGHAPCRERLLATGVLIDAGRHASLPLRTVRHVNAIELRDSHGRALAAQVMRRDESLGLALLRLDSPLVDAPNLLWAARDAFPERRAQALRTPDRQGRQRTPVFVRRGLHATPSTLAQHDGGCLQNAARPP